MDGCVNHSTDDILEDSSYLDDNDVDKLHHLKQLRQCTLPRSSDDDDANMY